MFKTKKIPGKLDHRCSDCGVALVRQSMEFLCPRCGLVEQFIDGVE